MLTEAPLTPPATRPYGTLRLITSFGEVEEPRWSFIEQMIAVLDGIHSSLLILETSGGAQLCLAGGRDGVMAVSGTPDGVRFYKTRRPAGPTHPVVVTCGGTALVFDWSECVRREEAVSITRVFYVVGRLHPQFKWVEEGLRRRGPS